MIACINGGLTIPGMNEEEEERVALCASLDMWAGLRRRYLDIDHEIRIRVRCSFLLLTCLPTYTLSQTILHHVALCPRLCRWPDLVDTLFPLHMSGSTWADVELDPQWLRKMIRIRRAIEFARDALVDSGGLAAFRERMQDISKTVPGQWWQVEELRMTVKEYVGLAAKMRDDLRAAKAWVPRVKKEVVLAGDEDVDSAGDLDMDIDM